MTRTSPRKKLTPAVQVTKVEKTVTATTNGTSSKTKVVSKIKQVTKKVVGKRKATSDDEHEHEHKDDSEEEQPKAAKKRKTKAKGAGAMIYAERTAVSSLKKSMYIGAHVSGAGGVHNAIQNATNVGANSFALFLKSQRKWESPPLAADVRDQFRALAEKHQFDAAKHALPHGSYLVNLAQADPQKANQAYSCFLDDLQRCEQLGIKLYNFHPGNTGGESREAACGRIAAQLNKSHKATKTVITVLENMAGTGNVVGSKFEDLRDIIAGVDDKSRVGVCIDTCHAFAAGYDLRTPEAFKKTFDEFEKIVGTKYLRAFHLNDSKAPFASNRDLHANIGTGFLGLRSFHSIMNHEPFQGMPMVLETPIDRKGPDGKSTEDLQIWAQEIKLLEGLIGADAESEEFKALETELAAKGADERNKLQDQVDRKAAKDAKKGTRKGGKRKKKDETDDEDSE